MPTAPDILHDTDWDQTFHAYGSAADAPEELAALLRDGPEALSEGMGYFHSAILHQGSVFPATPPATLFAAAVLDDLVHGRRTPDDAREWRVALLDALRGVAEAAVADRTDAELAELARLSQAERREVLDAVLDGDDEVWEEPALEALMWQALVDLRAAAPAMLAAVRPLLTHTEPVTRQRAAEAVSAIARMGRLEVDPSGRETG